MEGKRVVLLAIPAVKTVLVAYVKERYIRIGSSKENRYSVREFGNQCLLYSLDEVLHLYISEKTGRGVSVLKKYGYIERVGSRKTGYWKVHEKR